MKLNTYIVKIDAKIDEEERKPNNHLTNLYNRPNIAEKQENWISWSCMARRMKVIKTND